MLLVYDKSMENFSTRTLPGSTIPPNNHHVSAFRWRARPLTAPHPRSPHAAHPSPSHPSPSDSHTAPHPNSSLTPLSLAYTPHPSPPFLRGGRRARSHHLTLAPPTTLTLALTPSPPYKPPAPHTPSPSPAARKPPFILSPLTRLLAPSHLAPSHPSP
nr:proline-rich receptor-like protein kinase PERK10 [Penaeus vannamei]